MYALHSICTSKAMRKASLFSPGSEIPELTVVDRVINLHGALIQIKGAISCTKLDKCRLCGLSLSLQPCQDPCMQTRSTNRLSRDPKYFAGNDIMFIVVLGPTVPPGAPSAARQYEFCRGGDNI